MLEVQMFQHIYVGLFGAMALLILKMRFQNNFRVAECRKISEPVYENCGIFGNWPFCFWAYTAVMSIASSLLLILLLKCIFAFHGILLLFSIYHLFLLIHLWFLLSFRADEEPIDQKKYFEESCKPKCVKPLLEYQVCFLVYNFKSDL